MVREMSVYLHGARKPTDLLLKALQALDIVDEMKSFLHHKFLYWLEAHSCMQTQQDGPGTMLPLFYEWAMVSRTWCRSINE